MKIEKRGVATYLVDLAEHEAEILMQIMRRVGGSPSATGRLVTNEFMDKLLAAGVPLTEDWDARLSGSIHFEDSLRDVE